jgi:tripartite-type tricarboxylate transporter receptor subunit TctC
LNAEIQKILATPEAQAQLLDQGAYAVQTTPDQAAARVKQEIGMWAKVIKDANIRPD